MKQIGGGLLILAGVVLGLYVGGYLCLVGGIIQIIEQIQAPVIEASQVAWGIVRVLGAGLCGELSALVCIAPGVTLLKD